MVREDLFLKEYYAETIKTDISFMAFWIFHAIFYR